MTRLFVVALVLALPVSTHAHRPQPTFLGVVDKDGLLIPIAVYDGSQWWNRWPWGSEDEEIQNLPIPRSLASIPAAWLPPGAKLPGAWATLDRSGRRVPLRAVGLERSPQSATMDTIVARTTYRGRVDEYDERVAISGPGILARFVDPSPDEHDAILRQLQSRIAKLEADEIARWKKERIAAGGKDDFALTEVGMVTTASGTRYVDAPPGGPIHEYGLTRGEKPVSGSTYYQLHGERLFRMRRSEECFMRLGTDGVVVVGVAGKVDSEKLGSFAYSELCGDAAEISHELATITIESRTWWIVKSGGGESGDDYGLFDPRTAEPVDIKGRWGLRSNRER